MPNDVETLLREAAPQVTRQPDAFLAALGVSDEAAAFVDTAGMKRRRLGVGIGVAAVLTLAGANAAAAATQTLWWTAPHDVVAEAEPLTDTASRVTQISFILAADYASGVDGDSSDAQSAFQLAQQWLADRPIVVAVPTEAQTLTGDEEQGASDQGWPPQVALEHKAIRATEAALNDAVANAYDGRVAGLGGYLAEQGADPALIVIDREGGVLEVGR